jgi:hypothetical protein
MMVLFRFSTIAPSSPENDRITPTALVLRIEHHGTASLRLSTARIVAPPRSVKRP